ncbi:MAG: hypothetical protein ACE5HX_16955, partial [bacterium]
MLNADVEIESKIIRVQNINKTIESLGLTQTTSYYKPTTLCFLAKFFTTNFTKNARRPRRIYLYKPHLLK